jgi:hypothetical protein
MTPYQVTGNNVVTGAALNDSGAQTDPPPVLGLSRSGDNDSGGSSLVTFAVWAPIPEPGTATAVPMGLGLLGLSVRTRREG